MFSYKNEVDSEGSAESEASNFNTKFDVDDFCGEHKNIQIMYKRQEKMKEAMLKFGDIDSDDEDPLLLMRVVGIDAEFSMLHNLNVNTFMHVFSRVQYSNLRHKKPNLYKVIMKKINDLMEK